ncbi:MAG: Rha family transcriptional regulator, partial [Planktothrix sp.]
IESLNVTIKTSIINHINNMKLVTVHEGQAVVNTLDIAKHFSKEHSKVLRDIRNLDCSIEFSQSNFVLSNYTTRGKHYPCYLITRDGFAFLVMGFTGKKAAEWKEKYIKAYNQMEKSLLKQKDNEEWNQARLNSKGVRKSFTDTIKSFISYAEAQGSTQAKFYYSNLTKMEYKALLLVDKLSDDKDFRNQLDLMDLGLLIAAENICKLSLEEGMSKSLYYKEIYQLAKQRVNNYAQMVNPMKAYLPNRNQI